MCIFRNSWFLIVRVFCWACVVGPLYFASALIFCARLRFSESSKSECCQNCNQEACCAFSSNYSEHFARNWSIGYPEVTFIFQAVKTIRKNFDLLWMHQNMETSWDFWMLVSQFFGVTKMLIFVYPTSSLRAECCFDRCWINQTTWYAFAKKKGSYSFITCFSIPVIPTVFFNLFSLPMKNPSSTNQLSSLQSKSIFCFRNLSPCPLTDETLQNLTSRLKGSKLAWFTCLTWPFVETITHFRSQTCLNKKARFFVIQKDLW